MRLKQNFELIKKDFLENCTSELNVLFDNEYYQLLLYDLSMTNKVKLENLDKDELEQNLKELIEIGRINNDLRIVFFFKTNDIPYPNYYDIIKKQYLKTQEKVKLFFSKNESIFEQINGFKCFKDILLDKNEAIKYLNKTNYTIFNIEDWLEFFIKMFTQFYPNFKLSRKFSTKHSNYFLKSIGDSSYIGFKYDLKEQKYLLRTGVPEILTPDLIFIESDGKEYVIGKLKHPFFNCKPILLHYFLISGNEAKVDVSDLEGFYRDIIVEKSQSNLYRIFNHDELGEIYIKTAYFQFFIESVANNNYLNFLSELYEK